MALRNLHQDTRPRLAWAGVPSPTAVREPLHCTECAQPISVLYVPGARVQNWYECPLCKAVMEVAVPGTLIDWWAGH
jgi:hypothetical protein